MDALLTKLGQLDRRWLFLAMAFAVVLPLLVPFSLPFHVSPMVQNAFDAVENLPPGARVLISVDYDPAARPELDPYSRAVLRHLLKKRARIVLLTLWAKTPPMVTGLIREVIEGEFKQGKGFFAGDAHPEVRYGIDYANLGFKEGKEAAINALAQDMRRLYPRDAAGTALSRLPIFEGISTIRDFDLVISDSGGFPGAKEYVEQVVTRYNIPFIAATTAVSVTDLTPYYPRQIKGLVGGMRGSAEYEQLMGYTGLGTRGLNVLTVGQLLVIAAIVFGNILFFVERARRGAK